MIYKKLQKVSVSALNSISTGMVINVVASDLNRLGGIWNLPDVFTVPIAFIYTIMTLVGLFGWVTVFFFVSFFITFKLLSYFGKLKKKIIV